MPFLRAVPLSEKPSTSSKTWLVVSIFNNNDLYTIMPPFSQVGTVFANGPGDQGSVPGRVIPKT